MCGMGRTPHTPRYQAEPQLSKMLDNTLANLAEPEVQKAALESAEYVSDLGDGLSYAGDIALRAQDS